MASLVHASFMLLAEAPALLSSVDKEGRTPFLYSCACGHVPLADWLLHNGASLRELDAFGGSAFLCAADAGHVPMVWNLVPVQPDSCPTCAAHDDMH